MSEYYDQNWTMPPAFNAAAYEYRPSMPKISIPPVTHSTAPPTWVTAKGQGAIAMYYNPQYGPGSGYDLYHHLYPPSMPIPSMPSFRPGMNPSFNAAAYEYRPSMPVMPKISIPPVTHSTAPPTWVTAKGLKAVEMYYNPKYGPGSGYDLYHHLYPR